MVVGTAVARVMQPLKKEREREREVSAFQFKQKKGP